MAYSRAGNQESAKAILHELLDRSHREYVPPGSIGGVFAAMGERDSALTWLERAFAERSNAIAYLLVEPGNAPFRNAPRYQAMLSRAGLR